MDMRINPADTINLNLKIVVHKKCGNKHVDSDKFKTFNHRKHLCHYCNKFFYDDERGVGI